MGLFKKSAMPDMDPSFPTAGGQQYLQFLKRMHTHLEPDWYFEIGTAQGASLKQSKSKSIAVDPGFQIKTENYGKREQTHMYEVTSDSFFEERHMERLTEQVDLAFLDGMHLFEYLLRDFINTEKYCGPKSVIVLHDLVPPSYQAAERDWDRELTKVWTGDVWKVAVILKEYRPDLKVRVTNCRPTGLGIITDLDRNNDVLVERYDEIVTRFMDMTMQDYGTEKLADLLSIRNAQSHHFFDVAGDPAAQDKV